MNRTVLLLILATQVLAATSTSALPKRLILALDGVAYRDMEALQEGVTYKDSKGRRVHRQAFQEGYFPVSRNVSTFPSASDVAWTDIFGNRPLPGYQRTYFSDAEDAEIFVNGVTSSMEYEKQMTWQVKSGFLRLLGYIFPRRTFKYEVHELVKDFLNCKSQDDNYYALMRSTDDAQHLSADIFAMLCTLDKKLEELRAHYRAREGRELEILMLSDHGNNHAGPAKRVEIRSFLKRAGYRIRKSIRDPKDVVLPTSGIESWVEIHNAPSETEKLAKLLSHLEGVDVLTARLPDQSNRFLVLNSKGERAVIEYNPARNSFRYSAEAGDPLTYLPVVEALRSKHQISAEGFATADAWMAETLTHRYPLALERIVRGHTRAALNPASILISLKNDYVHAAWFIMRGSEFVRFGGTHGALDDLNSNGILLSSYAPTKDTSSSRIAALFDGFPGRLDYRAQEHGAEWMSETVPAPTATVRGWLGADHTGVPSEEVFLRVWTPSFTQPGIEARVDVTVQRVPRFFTAQIRPGDPKSREALEQHLTLGPPIALRDCRSYERVYAFPPDLILEPQSGYRISGRIRGEKRHTPTFAFAFRTDNHGLPVTH